MAARTSQARTATRSAAWCRKHRIRLNEDIRRSQGAVLCKWAGVYFFNCVSKNASTAALRSLGSGSAGGSPCAADMPWPPRLTVMSFTSTPAFWSTATRASDCVCGTVVSLSPWTTRNGGLPALMCVMGLPCFHKPGFCLNDSANSPVAPGDA